MRLNLKTFANPYLMFTLIWTFALVLYLFGWSERFPALSLGLISFLILAILSHFMLALITGKSGFFKYRELTKLTISQHNYLFLLNLFTWLLNFAYSGIPIIKILQGENYDYRDFGMPSVVVFTMSFNSFLCVYFYHIFLCSKQKKYLVYIGICFFFYIVIFSRGLIMMTGMSMFFLWLAHTKKKIGIKFFAGLAAIVLLITFLFGFAGNIRTEQLIASQTGAASSYKNTTILTIGSASQNFRESLVPNEFFWSYIYIASPISNLQYNVDNKPSADYSLTNIIAFAVNEFSFDFIAKRVDNALNITPAKALLVVDELTVSSIFAESFRYLGWVGVVCMLLFMLVFPLSYLSLIGGNSEFIPISFAIITSIYFFSFFDNMIVYSGLGLQVVYPFLIKYLNNFSSVKLTYAN